jgi:hypothetical protein
MRGISEEPLARVRRDPDSRTITLILDAAIASIAMFAIAAHANEREAHVREVERVGRSRPRLLRSQQPPVHRRQPDRSRGSAASLEQAYRTALDHDTAYRPPTPPRHKLTGVRRWSGLC